MPSAAILGTGLIGASIGLGLRGNGWTVTGWDPAPDALEAASTRGAVDHAATSEAAAVAAGSDLVVLAGPAAGIVATLGRLETELGVVGAEHLAHTSRSKRCQDLVRTEPTAAV